MSNPSTIVTSSDFTSLVSTNLGHSSIIGSRIILDRNLSSHTTHSMNTTLMASLNQQANISIHERSSHGNLGTIRENKLGMFTQALDSTEDVIPTATVQTTGVITQLIDDFIHLKDSMIVSIRTVPRIVPRGMLSIS